MSGEDDALEKWAIGIHGAAASLEIICAAYNLTRKQWPETIAWTVAFGLHTFAVWQHSNRKGESQ